PELRSNGIFEFRLYSNGTRKFYEDIQGLHTKDPLLGLWHKHEKLRYHLSSHSKRIQHVIKVCTTILEILGNNIGFTSRELQQHPKLHFLVNEKSYDWFRDKIRTLNKLGYIQETKSGKNRKLWKIPSDKESDTLIQEYKYNYRSQKKFRERNG
ncbi:MAG: hypothetical protein ACFFDT_21005, partial [Candidatus Hodarchaeota archaeon]